MKGLVVRFPLRRVDAVTLLRDCECWSIIVCDEAHDAQRKQFICYCIVDAVMFVAG